MKNLSKKRKISDETDKLWQKKEKINESNRIHAYEQTTALNIRTFRTFKKVTVNTF